MVSEWFPTGLFSPNTEDRKPDVKPKTKYEQCLARYEELPVEVRIGSTLALGSAAAFALVKIYTRFLRRYKTHGWITPDLYAERRWIKGIVTSVGDPDGFRLYHTPGPVTFWRLKGVPNTQKGLVDQTISIRLAGIDAPELGHFNKETQPFAEEALVWLKRMVLGQIVYCQLLKSDQYSRSVAAVVLPRRLVPNFLTPRVGISLADGMLRAGLAVTYLQQGAVYERGGKERLLAIEEEAKKKRRGQWVNGVNNESPSEYKKRHRSASVSESDAEEQTLEAIESKASSRARRERGFWSRLFGSAS